MVNFDPCNAKQSTTFSHDHATAVQDSGTSLESPTIFNRTMAGFCCSLKNLSCISAPISYLGAKIYPIIGLVTDLIVLVGSVALSALSRLCGSNRFEEGSWAFYFDSITEKSWFFQFSRSLVECFPSTPNIK